MCQYSITLVSDHDEFYRVTTAYSYAHRTMNNSARACPRWASDAPTGVTNGADWYPVEGGMQVWLPVD